MRCKQGDMAILLKTLSGANVGRIVDVTEYLGFFEQFGAFTYNGQEYRVPITDHYWWVTVSGERPLETGMGPTTKAYGPDSWMRPLRPDDPEGLQTHEKEKDDALLAG